MNKGSGFTFIELIIFIAITAIMMAGIFIGFEQVLSKITTPEENNIAVQLAKERMELILGQRRNIGFATFIDPCTGGSPPAICTLPTGYSIAQPTVTTNVDTNFKTITVAVSGTANATMIAEVANY